MSVTRRGFLGTIAAAVTLPAVASPAQAAPVGTKRAMQTLQLWDAFRGLEPRLTNVPTVVQRLNTGGHTSHQIKNELVMIDGTVYDVLMDADLPPHVPEFIGDDRPGARWILVEFGPMPEGATLLNATARTEVVRG